MLGSSESQVLRSEAQDRFHEDQQSSKSIFDDDRILQGVILGSVSIMMVTLLLNTEVSMDASERCFPMCQELHPGELFGVNGRCHDMDMTWTCQPRHGSKSYLQIP